MYPCSGLAPSVRWWQPLWQQPMLNFTSTFAENGALLKCSKGSQFQATARSARLPHASFFHVKNSLLTMVCFRVQTS